MTCIVGITDGHRMTIGGDSFAGNGEVAYQTANPKVFSNVVRVGASIELPLLIGCSGDFRGQSLLQDIPLPEQPCDWTAIQYMHRLYIPAVRQAFESNGFLNKNDGRDKHDMVFMLAYRGRLFTCWYEFDLVEPACQYAALGSGYLLAMGSLYTTRSNPDQRERVRTALEAAAAHSPYVRPDYHIISIDER